MNKFGVPCSKFKAMWNGVCPNTSEEEAMSCAAGAILAGKEPEVYIQNSGLGSIVNIVTSLFKPYGIPLPKLHVSNRSEPEHHLFMGTITIDLLTLLEYQDYVLYD